MKYHLSAFLAGLLLVCFSVSSYGQPATTSKTFRMYNDATHSVSITSGNAAGTGTFTWPQPAAGIFKSDGTGLMSISAIDLSGSDVTNVLNVSNGGTGTNSISAAGSVVYSNGSTFAYSPVGTAGQLFVSGGSGSPVWTNTFPIGITVPFDQISTGTNTTATLTVGTGAILVPSGTGVIAANQFTGTGSVTTAVDLGTAEVAGTLSPVNGGTGITSVGPAGSVAFSNGSQFSFTGAGASGQILTSNGAGTPTWNTVISAKYTGRVQGDGVNFSYTVTPPPASGYSASSVVVVSIESPLSQTITIISKTTVSFTIQTPNILSNAEFLNFAIY